MFSLRAAWLTQGIDAAFTPRTVIVGLTDTANVLPGGSLRSIAGGAGHLKSKTLILLFPQPLYRKLSPFGITTLHHQISIAQDFHLGHTAGGAGGRKNNSGNAYGHGGLCLIPK